MSRFIPTAYVESFAFNARRGPAGLSAVSASDRSQGYAAFQEALAPYRAAHHRFMDAISRELIAPMDRERILTAYRALGMRIKAHEAAITSVETDAQWAAWLTEADNLAQQAEAVTRDINNVVSPGSRMLKIGLLAAGGVVLLGGAAAVIAYGRKRKRRR